MIRLRFLWEKRQNAKKQLKSLFETFVRLIEHLFETLVRMVCLAPLDRATP